MNRTTVNKTPSHQERHGFESGLYKDKEVPYFAGNSSISTTQINLNPDIVKMKEKANLQ